MYGNGILDAHTGNLNRFFLTYRNPPVTIFISFLCIQSIFTFLRSLPFENKRRSLLWLSKNNFVYILSFWLFFFFFNNGISIVNFFFYSHFYEKSMMDFIYSNRQFRSILYKINCWKLLIGGREQDVCERCIWKCVSGYKI